MINFNQLSSYSSLNVLISQYILIVYEANAINLALIIWYQLVVMSQNYKSHQHINITTYSLTHIIIFHLLSFQMNILIPLLCLFAFTQALIKSKNGYLIDDQGRRITFRGPNVVVKIPPYYPVTQEFDVIMSFSQEDMKQLRAWGFNGIRLAVMWTGVEPKEGQYSTDYLNKMKDIVDLAGKYGIYSLIQFHQDLLSQKFCGDGAPIWLFKKSQTSTFPIPISLKHVKYNTSGTPDYKDCDTDHWGRYYFSFDVSYAFQDLYNNRFGMLDKFQKYWIQVAKTFKGNPNVIAYELINEPFAGAVFKNPLVIDPWVAESINLQRFYDRLAKSIREIDDSHPICFEPVTWNNKIKTGFSHPPGGFRYQDESVLCYHWYILPDFSEKAIKYSIDDAKRLKVSSILSQFSYKNKKAPEALRILHSNNQSWFFWEYKTFGKDWGSQFDSLKATDEVGLFYRNGSYIKHYVQLISQTYVQVLSGELISSSYDSDSKDFVLSFYTGNGSSIIYANRELNYPNGLVINAVPKNSVKITEFEQGYFQVDSLSTEGTRVLISIYKL